MTRTSRCSRTVTTRTASSIRRTATAAKEKTKREKMAGDSLSAKSRQNTRNTLCMIYKEQIYFQLVSFRKFYTNATNSKRSNFYSYHKTTRLAHEQGEDEFWLYDDDDAFEEDEDEDWEYFDEAAAAAEEAAKPQFLKGSTWWREIRLFSFLQGHWELLHSP